jgi:hypothetical protein
MTVLQVNVTVGLHTGMPDAVTAISVFTVVVDEVSGTARQHLTDDHIAILGVHDAESIAVLGIDVCEELIAEVGGGFLFD